MTVRRAALARIADTPSFSPEIALCQVVHYTMDAGAGINRPYTREGRLVVVKRKLGRLPPPS